MDYGRDFSIRENDCDNFFFTLYNNRNKSDLLVVGPISQP